MRRNKFGFTGESRLFISLSEKLTNGFYVLSAGIGTVLMTVGSSFVSSFDFGTKWNKSVGFWGSASIISFNPWTALTVGSLLLLIGSIGTYKDLDNLKKENKKLKEENNTVHCLKDSLNSTQEDCETLRDDIYGLHKKLVRTWLKEAFRQLGLNTYDRVTIYFEYEKQFFLLARHSLNPKLAEEHRQKFPLNQGALSLAWQHKEHVDINQCPVYKTNPDEYLDYINTKYEYMKEKADSFAMKSNNYVGIAIVDADQHIGVIFFESETPPGDFSEEKLQKIKDYCNTHQSHLCEFVRDALKYDRSAAKQEVPKIDAEQDFMEMFQIEGGRDG